MPYVTATSGIDCGSLTYRANQVSIIPSISGSVTSFSFDQIGKTYNINLDSSLIGAEGLIAEFSLAGNLV